ncbi:hypothetical protein VT84_03365 [Gemmata sp. SH-PL17]|uniref:head-tail connector protein n=1 Tax=Gemmata sp. SH-PL17 TaxID=1630693 RepID=UPI00078E2C20|nr:hypothetical protein [Gemmata sp. SH-PL17]AMV23422.1 hypothetical protein VT84_03365 [Gemmata sp. SH-PL17]
MIGVQVVTGPTVEPLTLEEVKGRLRITIADEDTDLEMLQTECRALCEAECHRAFLTTTFNLTLDDFPRCDPTIRVPRPPLQSVVSVKYFDATGTEQTIDPAAYWVATASEPGRIVPVAGYWPAVQCGRPDVVTVQFVAGYATPSDVPAQAKKAILVTMAERRENPTGEVGIPPAARRALDTLEFGDVR